MGQRENIIAWFDQLESSERNAVLVRLSPVEKSKLQIVLGQAHPTAEALPTIEQQETSTALRKKLIGAPDIFQRVHNKEDVSSYPEKLTAAVQQELDRLDKETQTTDSIVTTTDSSQLLIANLVDTLKNVWHRFLKTFN